MLDKIKSRLRRRKLKQIKEFGPEKKAVSFSLCAHDSHVAETLFREFAGIDRVEIVQGNILDLECDMLVSPANSFADMSGGLDRLIDNFYEGRAQQKAFEVIRRDYFGELPVGCALAIEMQTERFPYLMIAPTMRIPGRLKDSINAYLAMRALLLALAKLNANSTTVSSGAIPSLCTGVGGMSADESARQMKTAFENIVLGGWRSVKHPAMAPYMMK